MTTRRAPHIGTPVAQPTAASGASAPTTAPTTAPVASGTSPTPESPPLTTAEILAIAKSMRSQIHDTLQRLAALAAESSAGGTRHAALMAPSHRLAVPRLSKLLRDDPSLTGKYTADDIDNAMTAAQALEFLAEDFKSGVVIVKSAAATKYNAAWAGSSVVYHVAESDPNASDEIAATVASVRDILALGPRSKTAPASVTKAQTTATAATDRAQKAQVKLGRRTRSAQRAAQAHADAHPDVVIVPAPTPGTSGNNGNTGNSGNSGNSGK